MSTELFDTFHSIIVKAHLAWFGCVLSAPQAVGHTILSGALASYCTLKKAKHRRRHFPFPLRHSYSIAEALPELRRPLFTSYYLPVRIFPRFQNRFLARFPGFQTRPAFLIQVVLTQGICLTLCCDGPGFQIQKNHRGLKIIK